MVIQSKETSDFFMFCLWMGSPRIIPRVFHEQGPQGVLNKSEQSVSPTDQRCFTLEKCDESPAIGYYYLKTLMVSDSVSAVGVWFQYCTYIYIYIYIYILTLRRCGNKDLTVIKLAFVLPRLS